MTASRNARWLGPLTILMVLCLPSVVKADAVGAANAIGVGKSGVEVTSATGNTTQATQTGWPNTSASIPAALGGAASAPLPVGANPGTGAFASTGALWNIKLSATAVNGDTACTSSGTPTSSNSYGSVSIRAYPDNLASSKMSIAYQHLCLDDWHHAETLPWTNNLSLTIGKSPMISGRPSLPCYPNIKTPTALVAVGHASPTVSACRPSSSCYALAANGRLWEPPSSAPLPPPTTAFKNGFRPASSKHSGNMAFWPTMTGKASIGPG